MPDPHIVAKIYILKGKCRYIASLPLFFLKYTMKMKRNGKRVHRKDGGRDKKLGLRYTIKRHILIIYTTLT